MPHAPQIRYLTLRIGILTALSAMTFGAFTGVAAADTSQPAGAQTGTESPTDATPTPTDPEPTVDPTITFGTTPRATATAHARHRAHVRAARARHERQVRSVLRVAERQKGKPYSYGAAGPRAFDCSGLVMYVFSKAVGRQLPHNAAAQYHAVQHIKKRNLQIGDLVFHNRGGSISHVGIYAGHGKWWDAPHTGTVVHKHKIYKASMRYGRVLTIGAGGHHKNRHH
jgi:cell wall-associated NlpC family hydrolase